MAEELEPFDPEHLCPRCGSGMAAVASHDWPILIVFGVRRDYPCAGRDVGAHLCCRCEQCGHAWMGEPRTVPECSLDKESHNYEEVLMAIRKTGSATGEVTGVEDQGVTKNGIQAVAGRHDWASGDESELGAENDAADSGEATE